MPDVQNDMKRAKTIVSATYMTSETLMIPLYHCIVIIWASLRDNLLK